MSDDVKKDLLILQEILNQRKPYLKAYRDIEIEAILKDTTSVMKDNKVVEEPISPAYYVRITYHHPKFEWFEKNGSESIEFPLNDLPDRIIHYRKKLEAEKKKYGKKEEHVES